MPQILSFAHNSKRFISKEDRRIRGALRQGMLAYRPTLLSAIEEALSRVSGGRQLDPTTYYPQERVLVSLITDRMQAWWDAWIDVAVSQAERTYKGLRKVTIKEFSILFEIEYNEVSDDELPKEPDLDSAADIDLRTGELKRSMEAEKKQPLLTLVVGEGGIDSEFERHLQNQFNAKLDPRNRITTFSARDVARIKNEMILGMRRGVDQGVIRNKLTRQLVKVGALPDTRRMIASRVMTILRTTHQNAAIASAFMFARTNPVVVGVVRQVGPRPCMACLVLAGRIYRRRQQFRDHPNGMCYVTYLMPTPESMGINVTTLAVATRRAWRRNFGEVKNPQYSFLELPEVEQRARFGSDSLYHLWKEEKFPLEKLAVYKSGVFVQASYQDALAGLHTWGGVSYPLAKFADSNLKRRLNHLIDPRDRANAALLIIARPPPGADSRLYPSKITDDMVSHTVGRARDAANQAMAGYENVGALPWYAYNELARALNFRIRKSISGTVYFVIYQEG